MKTIGSSSAVPLVGRASATALVCWIAFGLATLTAQPPVVASPPRAGTLVPAVGDLDLSLANPTVLSDGVRRYLPGAPGAGYEEAGTWWSGLADLTRSPILYISQAGATTTPVHYDPYGGPLPGSADPVGFGYAAEWKNATGLINLRARSYDPLAGRFTARDTFGGVLLAPQTANRYAYAFDNPLRYGDPTGRFGRAWNSWGASALEIALTFNPVGFGLIAGYELLTGTDPATGEQLDRAETLRELGLVIGTFGVAKVLHAALPLLRGTADDAARLADDAARVGRDAVGVGGRSRFVGNEAGHLRLGAAARTDGRAAAAVGRTLAPRPSPRILAANMEVTGLVRPAGLAAHHVVAGTAPQAARARSILARFEIDINAAENGVFLPRTLSVPNPQGVAPHSTLHTASYYEAVTAMHRSASNRDEALEVLGFVRQELLAGRPPGVIP